MVFNVVTGNRDDHAKNFSFVYRGGRWYVSPAYDLVRSYGFNGQHTTTINGNGLPGKDDIIAVACDIGISKNLATKILEETKQKTKTLMKHKIP